MAFRRTSLLKYNRTFDTTLIRPIRRRKDLTYKFRHIQRSTRFLGDDDLFDTKQTYFPTGSQRVSNGILNLGARLMLRQIRRANFFTTLFFRLFYGYFFPLNRRILTNLRNYFLSILQTSNLNRVFNRLPNRNTILAGRVDQTTRLIFINRPRGVRRGRVTLTQKRPNTTPCRLTMRTTCLNKPRRRRTIGEQTIPTLNRRRKITRRIMFTYVRVHRRFLTINTLTISLNNARSVKIRRITRLLTNLSRK